MTTRRRFIKGFAALLVALGVTPEAWAWVHPGGGPAASSGSITTFTLANNSSSPQSVLMPIHTAGQPVKMGDIPAGYIPQHKIGGTVLSISIGTPSYWPDGSLKWYSHSTIPSATVAGSGSQVVQIGKVAGSLPTGSRTLSELYSQNLVINMIVSSVGTANGLTGGTTVSAWLNGNSTGTNANGSNLLYGSPIKWIDGAAVTGWKLSFAMSTSPNGSQVGGLVCDFYVLALSNTSGGLGAYRFAAAIRQPVSNYNATQPAAIYFVPPNQSSPALGCNWQVNAPGGGTVTNPLVMSGSDGNPLATLSFVYGARFSISGISSSGIMTVTSVAFSPANLGSNPNGSVGGPYPPGIVGTPNGIPIQGTTGGGSSGGASTNTYVLGDGGVNITPNTYWVTNQISGTPGGSGTYQLNPAWAGTLGAQTCDVYWNGNVSNAPVSFPAYGPTTASAGYPTIPGVNWDTGCTDNGGTFPVVVTASGTLPTLASGGGPGSAPNSWGTSAGMCSLLLQAQSSFNVALNITQYTRNSGIINQCFNQDHFSFSSAGMGTMQVCPFVNPASRFNVVGVDGKYLFFQGSGTYAADTTLRHQGVPSYWQGATGTINSQFAALLPPFDLSHTGSSWGSGDGAIQDYSPASIPGAIIPYWNPYAMGDNRLNWAAGGDGAWFRWFPSEAVIDFYNWSQLSEMMTRVQGWSAGVQGLDFKDATTGTIPNVGNPANTYVGLPINTATSTNTQWLSGLSSIIFQMNRPEHETNNAIWAWLRTGEYQFLDFLLEMGINQVISGTPTVRNPTQTVGGQFGGTGLTGAAYSPAYGLGTYGGDNGQFRNVGWSSRDIQAAALYFPWNPATGLDWDGVNQFGKYLNDLADANANVFMDGLTQVYPTQWPYAYGRGLWSPFNYDGTYYCTVDGMEYYQATYFMGAMCMAVMRGNAKAKSFLAQTFGKDWVYIGNTFKGTSANGLWGIYTIASQLSLNDATTQSPALYCNTAKSRLGLITSDEQWANSINNTQWTWSSTGSSPYFMGNYGANGVSPQTGDRYVPDRENTPPGAGGCGWNNLLPWALNTPLWAINVNASNLSAVTFDLSSTDPNVSTTLVVPTNSQSGDTIGAHVAWNAPPMTGFDSAIGGDGAYLIMAVARWCMALGIDASDYGVVSTDAFTRLGTNVNGQDVGTCMQTSYA